MIPLIAANVLRTFVSTLGRPVFATAITAWPSGSMRRAITRWSLAIGALRRWA
jgi:MATE family multidrug resistance protein